MQFIVSRFLDRPSCQLQTDLKKGSFYYAMSNTRKVIEHKPQLLSPAFLRRKQPQPSRGTQTPIRFNAELKLTSPGEKHSLMRSTSAALPPQRISKTTT